MKHYQRGQVLIIGVVMMVMILLAILFLFDIHNVIRSKFKVNTAQQAAALTGAKWQMESLNLIGEINLIKACESLLYDDSKWADGLSTDIDVVKDQSIINANLRSRINLLTEMQTRVSFTGPLVGFAAANQAAKANGLNPVAAYSLSNYLELLNEDPRYLAIFNGAPDTINNYRWKDNYIWLISDIMQNGIAVSPNSRMAGLPHVDPSELALQSFYEDIWRHDAEIKAGDPPPDQSSWKDNLYRFVKKWRDGDFSGKWWDIDYSYSRFPNESEIFTLGVEFNNNPVDYNSTDYYQRSQPYLADMMPAQAVWTTDNVFDSLRWCVFDKLWYPEYFRQKYSNYDEDYYNFWFKGEVLRKPIKAEYIYEGPCAYVESYVDMDIVSRYGVRKSTQNYNPLKDIRIGSKRMMTNSSNDTNIDDYRPGAAAKVFGKLEDHQPPISIPLILPVFSDVASVPTYMPEPYTMSVMRFNVSDLDRFLRWLSGESSLDGTPTYSSSLPYLYALTRLCDGKGFRYYGWNPNFDPSAFDKSHIDKADTLFSDTTYYYQQSNATGAGWLQQVQVFVLSGKRTDTALKETTTDYVNHGKATRYYESATSNRYVVLDANNHFVTNDEADPTIYYNISGGGGGGYGTGGYGGGSADSGRGPGRF